MHKRINLIFWQPTCTNDENHEMVEKHDVCNVVVGCFKNTKPDLNWLQVEPQGRSGYIEINEIN